MKATVIYLKYGECLCKCEMGRYNVVKGVETMYANKDKNADAFFPYGVFLYQTLWQR